MCEISVKPDAGCVNNDKIMNNLSSVESCGNMLRCNGMLLKLLLIKLHINWYYFIGYLQ